MKRWFLLCAAACILLFSACGKLDIPSMTASEYAVQLYGAENVLQREDGSLWIKITERTPYFHDNKSVEVEAIVLPWVVPQIPAELNNQWELSSSGLESDGRTLSYSVNNRGDAAASAKLTLLVLLDDSWYTIPDRPEEPQEFTAAGHSTVQQQIILTCGETMDTALPSGHYCLCMQTEDQYAMLRFDLQNSDGTYKLKF